ncbi:hypothetical protein PACTADRAFT_47536 [Pachysolen tannophilus NRRL Y-2460]|uniref:Uncharacterized protein n=1 Tax=Pachysolen tannophilus NRRL Y-2460 TaxID=669874 RepID=A0A1E4U0Z7_PACTA|nr:hypothetical protein PACTADRAFT_47536 [Pachysolen tannophilus NRRL Y-2460]
MLRQASGIFSVSVSKRIFASNVSRFHVSSFKVVLNCTKEFSSSRFQANDFQGVEIKLNEDKQLKGNSISGGEVDSVFKKRENFVPRLNDDQISEKNEITLLVPDLLPNKYLIFPFNNLTKHTVNLVPGEISLRCIIPIQFSSYVEENLSKFQSKYVNCQLDFPQGKPLVNFRVLTIYGKIDSIYNIMSTIYQDLTNENPRFKCEFLLPKRFTKNILKLTNKTTTKEFLKKNNMPIKTIDNEEFTAVSLHNCDEFKISIRGLKHFKKFLEILKQNLQIIKKHYLVYYLQKYDFRYYQPESIQVPIKEILMKNDSDFQKFINNQELINKFEKETFSLILNDKEDLKKLCNNADNDEEIILKVKTLFPSTKNWIQKNTQENIEQAN